MPAPVERLSLSTNTLTFTHERLSSISIVRVFSVDRLLSSQFVLGLLLHIKVIDTRTVWSSSMTALVAAPVVELGRSPG